MMIAGLPAELEMFVVRPRFVVYPGLGQLDLTPLNQTDLTESNFAAPPAGSSKSLRK
jgi:hypothetical protein